jgi:hypothetical protein
MNANTSTLSSLSLVVITDAGTRRTAAGSVVEAIDLHASAIETWGMDDRFVGAHIEDADGARYLPSRDGRELVAYEAPRG